MTFDQSLCKEQCLEHTLKHIKNGSIVVFHDSDKSFKNLDFVLPKVLEHFGREGYEFKSLIESKIGIGDFRSKN